MDYSELLIGITEIAVALAGFTGVVVVFGSRKYDSWHSGDRLRLSFLLEASLTAGAFSLLALLLLFALPQEEWVWMTSSGLWALWSTASLESSRRRLKQSRESHGDVDQTSNQIVFIVFALLIIVQITNATLWRDFAPFLAALILNLSGAAMQFTRLIRSGFSD